MKWYKFYLSEKDAKKDMTQEQKDSLERAKSKLFPILFSIGSLIYLVAYFLLKKP